jgi:hypothetical protein
VFKKRAKIKYKSKNENSNDMMLFILVKKRINISENNVLKAISVEKYRLLVQNICR